MVCVHEEEEEEVCAIGEGTQVQSLLFTSQGLLRHTWPLLSLSSLCGFVSVCLHVPVCVSHKCSSISHPAYVRF